METQFTKYHKQYIISKYEMSFKKILNAIKPWKVLVCAPFLKQNDFTLHNVSESSGIGIKVSQLNFKTLYRTS